MYRVVRLMRSRMVHLVSLNRCAKLGIGVLVLFVYCEFFIYYVTLLRCSWPQLTSKNMDILSNTARGNQPLKIMVLADTHLLGYRQGHWWDKLRREWQMQRSFQSTMLMHNPDLVFVLGDLFDEGKWADDAEFNDHLSRFKKMFSHSSRTRVEVVVGNHDIGFHYAATERRLKRFEKGFNTKAVKLLSIKDNLFVMVNSMALEGDGCTICKAAKQDLRQIQHILNCSKKQSKMTNCTSDEVLPYSKPVILQHFPLYRPSDAVCTTPDRAPDAELYAEFREKWDCLSKQATSELLSMIDPRLVLSAHTHHGCYTVHETKQGTHVPEWTVASFSWRNKKQPTFLLMVLSNGDYSIKRCSLPHEYTVVLIYALTIPILLLWFISPLCCRTGLFYRKSH